MANSDFLRRNVNQHTVKNSASKIMDKSIDVAMSAVINELIQKYPQLRFVHEKSMKLTDIISALSNQYPKLARHFSKVLATSFIKPDGGFLFAENSRGELRLILVAEVKRQGTNDKRLAEGKKKQAKGNAIERLGKNLIGIRTVFKNEGILPFVCFGSGIDFHEESSIIDRVITMNEFFPLNKVFVEKDFLPFEPVSMLFKEQEWTADEMAEKMLEVANRAINYNFV